MKLGAFCISHAVHGPCPAVRREVFCYWRVPVTTLIDRLATLEKLIDEFVQRLDDFIAVRDGKRAAGTEVVLYIDYQKRLLLFSHSFTGFT